MAIQPAFRSAGNDDERNGFQQRVDLQAAEQGFAFALRHAVIGDDKIGIALHRRPERLHDVGRRQDLQAIGLKPELERLQDPEIVVDDENFRR